MTVVTVMTVMTCDECGDLMAVMPATLAGRFRKERESEQVVDSCGPAGPSPGPCFPGRDASGSRSGFELGSGLG